MADAFERYLARKRALGTTGDLVDDFRRGWDMHVEFGVDNPALYDLMYGRPAMGRPPPAAVTARSELMDFMRGLENATDVAESAATGVTLRLIRTRRPASDPAVAITRDAVMDAVIAPAPSYGRTAASPELAAAAARLRERLPHGPVAALRATETALLRDWLDVLGATGPDGPRTAP